MTIALGMLASDGIVLAADTQVGQGQGDSLKTGSGKIAVGYTRVFNDPTKTQNFAITGAGNAACLDALRKSMVAVFESEARKDDIKTLGPALQASLENFYTQHIIPFEGYPPNERPDVWLIMAAQRGDEKFLWSTEKNLLIPQFQHATVGAGAMYANILFSNTYVEFASDKTALLAAYITFQTKLHIDGCGQDTDIFILKKDAPRFIDRRTIRKLEEILREYSRVEAGMLLHALGYVVDFDPNGTTPVEALEHIREQIKILGRSKGGT